MKRVSSILFFISSLSISFSCSDLLLEDDPGSDPVTCYDLLWKEFDEFYGEFQVKKINWDSLGRAYRARVNHNTTNKQLFDVFSELLDNLNDSHVILGAPGIQDPVFHSGILKDRAKDDFYLETVINNYLADTKKTSSLTYGRLNGNVGYIYIADFEDDQNTYKDAMNTIFNELQDVHAWIVDIRNNDGGNDAASQLVAGYFSTQKARYMSIRRKNGPAHDAFGPTLDWYVAPRTAEPISRKIALLTNRWTISSGETFAMAMKINRQVIHVGDTTTGAFSDSRDFVLPNGFWTRIPTSEVIFADGKSYEGIGLAPDVYVKSEKQALLSGIDKVLETAIQLIQ